MDREEAAKTVVQILESAGLMGQLWYSSGRDTIRVHAYAMSPDGHQGENLGYVEIGFSRAVSYLTKVAKGCNAKIAELEITTGIRS
jgi:hypothetical protein